MNLKAVYVDDKNSGYFKLIAAGPEKMCETVYTTMKETAGRSALNEEALHYIDMPDELNFITLPKVLEEDEEAFKKWLTDNGKR